ncbi:predicted extracellular nuclease [Longilinea arvoryzae]|uniref:Predicted extracellular nuclease n=1 Tax=Longilinea arvoryzae TaxID=360412 RepID=A0A0S7B778_9CHLR|nr:ExeM/NucH family extracellular endonuclease [Longilinea arvoryzae]GAP12862.1 predicted extracellular nuclease [Longilinea arvoryzae]
MNTHFRFLNLLVALAMATGGLALPLQNGSANTVVQSLPFAQDWSDAGLITINDNWSAVPGIMGYRGDNLASVVGANPQTILAADDNGVMDVNANLTNPNIFATYGVAEFTVSSNTVVALAGDMLADAPYLLISISTVGMENILVRYLIRDIESSPDESVQPVALHYRIGSSGAFTNLPEGFVADATDPIEMLPKSTQVDVTLPPAANNQALVQLRIMTANAFGNDEWVGIDDISITGSAIPDPAPYITITSPTNGETGVATAANLMVTFNEPVSAPATAFTLTCGTSGPHSYDLVTTDDLNFQLDPVTDFSAEELCTLNVLADQVTDLDTIDPYDHMLADFSFSFRTLLADPLPTVSSTEPLNSAEDVPTGSDLSVTFSEPVNASTGFFTIQCTYSGVHAGASSTVDSITYTINPVFDFWPSEACTVTLENTLITEQGGLGRSLVEDYSWNFSTAEAIGVCDGSYLPIYAIQGGGATAAITGPVTTQGVVVGDYEGASPNLQGFYLQDPTGDGNPVTSDGIFVYNPGFDSVAPGNVVRVSAVAGEYQGQTQLSSISSISICGQGTVSPTEVTLPFESAEFPERYEGMLVALPQTLYVTDHYLLGRFGQVTLSSGARLQQPTNVVAPGAAAVALQAQNDLNRILLDDATNASNADPILFGRGGLPLSAANTLRAGDSLSGVVGVMTYTWAGNSASPNAYRVRPLGALGGSIPNFLPANPRPTAAPAVGGAIQVAGFNTLNYFNTFGSACMLGVGGALTDCRGADDPIEFGRQSAKLVQAILASGAEVIGLVELENDGYGPTSAIQDLVDRLNAAATPGAYAFIDADAHTGQLNALGTDAIKVGFIYRPAAVTPVGVTAALNSAAFVTGGDSANRNRPALAQAFADNISGARFVAVINHFKSKGSACDAPDAGDGQGNCNAVRLAAANALAAWLATDPTGTGDPDVLILGDLNAYAMEDPIAALQSAGYTELAPSGAYSYAYDGQWGALDHALASASLAGQVAGAAEFHINADEPAVLDYNTEYKTAGQLVSLYSADVYRAADHDPLIVGLNLHTLPRLASLDLNAPFTTGVTQTFHINLENLDIGATYPNVLLRFRIANAELADIASFEYLTDEATWVPMPLSADNADLLSSYGPQGGFPLSAPAEMTFTFRINFNTPEFFHFSVTLDDLNWPSNASLASLSATALVFTPNSSPVAVNQSFTIDEDMPLVDVLDVTDAENDPLEFVRMAGPEHGELLLDSATGAFTYTPAAEWSGSDSFTYNVGDGRGGQAGATVSITVTPVNDDPIAPTIADAEWTAGESHTYVIPAATDIDSAALTYTAALADGSAWPAWLSFDPETLTFSGTPPNSAAGAHAIRVTVSDGDGGTDSAVFTLKVIENPFVVFLPFIER